jgi:hypothetical protein
MNPNDLPDEAKTAAAAAPEADLLAPLLQSPAADPTASAAAQGVVVGELLALAEGATPLVRYPGQAGFGALRARSTVDLHGQHIGRDVLLAFEQGDPRRPVVIGMLRGQAGWPLENPPAQVEVDAEGQRLVVTAKEQLVLRCGKASITLTKAGKVLIEGSYLSSRSSGVNRITGGSVQLN